MPSGRRFATLRPDFTLDRAPLCAQTGMIDRVGPSRDQLKAAYGATIPDLGGPQTEMIQLIHVATLAGKPIDYDPLTGKITNVPEANVLLHREYRAGWTL